MQAQVTPLDERRAMTMRVIFLSRLRYRWLFVVLMLLVVEAVPAFGADRQGAVSGEANFNSKCTRCHGANGKGNGIQALALFFMFRVPDFTNPAYMQTRSDEVLFRNIKQGNASMPSFGLNMTDPEIKDLVAYVRSFSKAPGPAKPVGAAR